MYTIINANEKSALATLESPLEDISRKKGKKKSRVGHLFGFCAFVAFIDSCFNFCSPNSSRKGGPAII